MSRKGRTCDSVDCSKPANLQCPRCKQLDVENGSYFCEQKCFKASWKAHKLLHQKPDCQHEEQLFQIDGSNFLHDEKRSLAGDPPLRYEHSVQGKNEEAVDGAMQSSRRSQISKIVARTMGLGHLDIIKTIIPLVERIVLSTVDMEELVTVLGEHALQDAEKATTAGFFAGKIWDGKLHSLIQIPLIKQVLTLYNKRDELRDKYQYVGFCVYMCELFRYLRYKREGEEPRLPISAEIVVTTLKGLVGPTEKPLDDNVRYFHQEFSNIAKVFQHFSPNLLDDLVEFKRERLYARGDVAGDGWTKEQMADGLDGEAWMAKYWFANVRC